MTDPAVEMGLPTAPGAKPAPWTKVNLSGKKGAGRFLKVDIEDYDKVQAHRWMLSGGRPFASVVKTDGGGLRSFSSISPNRLVLGITDASLIVKSVNGDFLDVRKSNLTVHSKKTVPSEAKPGTPVVHREPRYYCVFTKKPGYYFASVGDKYLGHSDDRERVAFIVDVHRVASLGWKEALRTGRMNFPERKEAILQAVRNNEHENFRSEFHGGAKKEGYDCVHPRGGGFFGKFKYKKKTYRTGTFPKPEQAAKALYELRVKRMGKRRAAPLNPFPDVPLKPAPVSNLNVKTPAVPSAHGD